MKLQGDTKRFESTAFLVEDHFYGKVKHVADVAGGQGLLSRILNKKYNMNSVVIDPRGNTLTGLENVKDLFSSDMADYYDLVIGLHPDSALKPVVESSLKTNTICIPCCNFWSEEKIGLKDMTDSIELWYKTHNVNYTKFELIGLTTPTRFGFVTFK